jgi:hypothetical protein
MVVARDTVINRNEQVLYGLLDPDSAVLMSDASNDYYGLNGVGARIWELLGEGSVSLADLCAQLCREFDVDAVDCEASVRRFVSEAIDCDLIRAAPP